MNRRNFLQIAAALPATALASAFRRPGAQAPAIVTRRRAPGDARPASRPATSAAAARSSGAAPIARRGCSSSTPRPSGSRSAPRARAGGARDLRLHRRVVAHRSAGRPAHLLPRASTRISRDLRTWSEPAAGSFTHAVSARRGTSRSPGRPTRSARAGASTPTGAACASTKRCAARSRTSSSTSATRSTPTGRSSAEVKLDDGTGVEERRDRGEVEGRRDARTTIAAATSTT